MSQENKIVEKKKKYVVDPAGIDGLEIELIDKSKFVCF